MGGGGSGGYFMVHLIFHYQVLLCEAKIVQIFIDKVRFWENIRLGELHRTVEISANGDVISTHES